MTISCQEERQFKDEEAVLEHFNKNRQQFEMAASMYSRLGLEELDIREDTSDRSPVQAQLVHIGNNIGVTRISTIPSSGDVDQQYVEFKLAGHPSAPYGVIFVPAAHARAMNSILSEAQPPPGVYQRIRNISDGWFYFEYQF